MSDIVKKPKFIETYLNFSSTTRFFTTPFSWLYVIIALAYVALPIFLLVTGIRDFRIFSNADYWGWKVVFAFILTVIAAFAGAFIAFYVAWDGKKNLSTDKLTSDFVVDSIGELIQVNFKAFAHFLAVFGFFAGLFALIFGQELLRLVKYLFVLIMNKVVVRIFKFIIFYCYI